MVWKSEHIQWAAVPWLKIPCWCQRSEEYGQIAFRWQKGNSNSNNHSLNQGMHKTISECTTRPATKEMGYSSREPPSVPPLSARNRNLRLQFARAYQNWITEDWKKVAWSEKSQVLLRHLDGRVQIWRKHHGSIFNEDKHCKCKQYFSILTYTARRGRQNLRSAGWSK